MCRIKQSLETFWEKAAKTKMGTYLTDVEMNFFLENVDFSKFNNFCDIGAEAGKFALVAAQNLAKTVAIDIDICGLKRIRAKDASVDVILADAKKIPFKKETFDVLSMIEVLDYIPELNTVISECRRILKIGGSLIFSFGNKNSLKSKFRELQGKHYIHSYRKVITTLNETGFKIISAQGFNWFPFSRTSQSHFIPLLAKIEKFLGLRKICRFSPWVLIHAVRLW